jgi:hypothetical protein
VPVLYSKEHDPPTPHQSTPFPSLAEAGKVRRACTVPRTAVRQVSFHSRGFEQPQYSGRRRCDCRDYCLGIKQVLHPYWEPFYLNILIHARFPSTRLFAVSCNLNQHTPWRVGPVPLKCRIRASLSHAVHVLYRFISQLCQMGNIAFTSPTTLPQHIFSRLQASSPNGFCAPINKK